VAATIKIGDQTATISDFEWSGDQSLVDTLNALLDPSEPNGSDPNPDWTAAQNAIKELGGRMIRFDRPFFDPRLVY
jgi:hypothetical protein